MEWEFFAKASEKLFLPYTEQEFIDEVKGIAEGAQKAGVQVSWQEILAWNGYEELVDYWWPNEKEGEYAKDDEKKSDRCSAFITTGSATKSGKIVMAHNSWDNF